MYFPRDQRLFLHLLVGYIVPVSRRVGFAALGHIKPFHDTLQAAHPEDGGRSFLVVPGIWHAEDNTVIHVEGCGSPSCRHTHT